MTLVFNLEESFLVKHYPEEYLHFLFVVARRPVFVMLYSTGEQLKG